MIPVMGTSLPLPAGRRDPRASCERECDKKQIAGKNTGYQFNITVKKAGVNRAFFFLRALLLLLLFFLLDFWQAHFYHFSACLLFVWP